MFEEFASNFMLGLKRIEDGFEFVRTGIFQVIDIKISNTVNTAFSVLNYDKGTKVVNVSFFVCCAESNEKYENDLKCEKIANEIKDYLESQDGNIISYSHYFDDVESTVGLFQVSCLFYI